MAQIRCGFVSNSSSTSFIICAPYSKENKERIHNYLQSPKFTQFMREKNFVAESFPKIRNDLTEAFTHFLKEGFFGEGYIQSNLIHSKLAVSILDETKINYTELDKFEVDEGRGYLINVCTPERYRKIKGTFSKRFE